jgi:transposase InsO family protein
VAEGEVVNIKRVARLMREADIVPKATRRFVVTTNSKSKEPPAPDLLERRFTVGRPNQAWVCDTTFIRTRVGWLYLAIVLDLFSRHIIGWSMGSRNNKALVIDAITMAVWRRKRPQGVIVHSDQGSTYRSKDHRAYLEKNHLVCSMSRKGECLDNAVAESFFGTLKTEHVDYQNYRSRDQARRSIFEYIELFYNVRRRHSTIGYVSPIEFERNASD